MHVFPEPVRLACGEATLSVHSLGEGDPIILCHGFPELAFSWRHQLPALADAGFRAIAPDLRGYGGSSKPPHVDAYRVDRLMDDLDGLLDALGIAAARWVGHDWGSLLLWHYALLRPARIRSMAVLNIPFAPRRAIDPMVMARELLGDEFYIVNFQDSDEADTAFDADPERFLRAMYRRLPTTRAAFETLAPGQQQPFSMLREMRKPKFPGTPLFDDDTLQVYVDAFRRGGFTPPINWYRNWSANWQLLEGVPQTITVPTLFIGAVDDVLIAPAHVETMRRYVNELDVHMVDNCGHWTQQEQPDIVNRLLIDWFGSH